MQGEPTAVRSGAFRDSAAQSGMIDPIKGSLGGGSGTVTYSTLANVPKAKRQKLIAEAKPMVGLALVNRHVDGWSQKVKRHLECHKES